MAAPKRIGTTMYVVAAVLCLILLTSLFSGMLDSRNFPNRDPQGSINDEGNIEIVLERSRNGHYIATGYINGEPVEFLVDTGATAVAIPSELASRLRLRKGQQVSTITANGIAIAHTTTIDELQLGDIIEHHVPATLVPNLPGGQILLGMSFLKRLDFSQRDDTLVLETK